MASQNSIDCRMSVPLSLLGQVVQASIKLEFDVFARHQLSCAESVKGTSDDGDD